MSCAPTARGPLWVALALVGLGPAVAGCDQLLRLGVAGGAAEVPCRSAADCPGDQVCDHEHGCSAPTCGLPPAREPAIVGIDERCSPAAAERCAAGLVCAARLRGVRDDGQPTVVEGVCAAGCDPCAPSCPAGMHCIQRPEGGGFCHVGPLAVEGEVCDSATCGPGFECAPAGWFNDVLLSAQMRFRCVRRCAPQGPLGEVVENLNAPSSDCAAGQVCRRHDVSSASAREGGSSSAFVWGCVAGELVASREACDEPGRRYCRSPERCVAGQCYTTDCRGCRCVPVLLETGETLQVCPADGKSPLAAPCSLDRHCQTGLRCFNRPGGSPFLGATYPNACLPAS